jgi:peptidoglycan/xylan/chitin deacetylase (PgdA/CDA1 family)
MYHDVVDDGAEDSSGFVGRAAAFYKVTPRQLEAHLDAIVGFGPGTSPGNGFVATFDDGGVTAMTAADALERRGLRGQFLVTVNYIGTHGFVSKSDLRELESRGHSIGSHSCSHPLRMGHCTWSQLIHEWVHSRAVLSDLLSRDIRIGSIPGGDCPPRVARAAALAGYTKLFTSEPDRVPRHAHGVTLIGRFAVRRWDVGENGGGARRWTVLSLRTAGAAVERTQADKASRRRTVSAVAAIPVRGPRSHAVARRLATIALGSP